MTDIVEVLSEHIAASEHDHPSGADAYISDASVAELRVAVATILSLRLKLEGKWQDISTAPKDANYIRLWAAGRERHGSWNNDQYATKPRPYWSFETPMGTNYVRANQPTHWMEPAPPPQIMEEGK